MSASDPLLNEFVHNHTGSDTNEYVEVFGDPGTDYSNFTVLEVEGDNISAGLIDGVFPVGTTDANGFWTTGFLNNQIENGAVTLLLVEDFSGIVGEDLDLDDDGALDVTPWTRIVDDVAVTDGGSADRAYSAVVLSPGFDGAPYIPGGASRIPNGTDTDWVNDWVRNDFDGAGLPGFAGTPDIGEAINTPGALNQAVSGPVDLCEGDFEPDGDVDGSDLAIFAADFGRTDCASAPTCEGDFDTDNDVDGTDLAIFAADFGRTDCP